jgi:NAD(P)-dependent dehydrogenase (short-subunit alcohol dehydrogenase family)
MEQLSGKVAVITGGASGIGRAVASAAATAKMKLVLADIEERTLDATAKAFADGGADVLAVVTDVAESSSVEALRDRALAHFGAVHVVHNNAGVGGGGPMWAISEADWRWVLGVNLWGVIHGIRAFVPLFIEQGEGHVVNTASLAGLLSPAFMGPYCASKHAVVTMSEVLFRDLQAVGANVGVSVLCPAYVRTGIAESERNRPVWAPAPDATDPLNTRIRERSRQLVADGIDATVVADRVLDAIRTNRFYIITHPEQNFAIDLRMRDILEGRSPTPLTQAPTQPSAV